MTLQKLPVHPDDLLFFNEVAQAMKLVAKQYELPLRTISGYPMPQNGMANRLGDCSHTGDIRLVLRCTVDGQWCDAPMSPKEVWDTAAHELAHLRHMNHGVAFQEFEEELRIAIKNRQEDHTQKVLDRLVKLQKSRESEATLGNEAAAEAFAGLINKMLIEYELNPNDIDYARATDRDPVIEIPVDLAKYTIQRKKSRIGWQESLARVVAKAHLCSFLICPGSNRIVFVGTKSHATVAEYAYGTLVPATHVMARRAYVNWEYKCRHMTPPQPQLSAGYKEAWLSAFVERIEERFAEARKAALVEVPNTSTGLMRLSGALLKTQKYIDNKFSGKRKYVNALNGGSQNNEGGRQDGRSAADSMVLGRRGVNPAPTRGLIGGEMMIANALKVSRIAGTESTYDVERLYGDGKPIKPGMVATVWAARIVVHDEDVQVVAGGLWSVELLEIRHRRKAIQKSPVMELSLVVRA